MVRATKSAITKKQPPTMAAMGISVLKSESQISLATCGATKPTNPIKPLNETTAAVIIVATKINIFFVLSIFTPRLDAYSSSNCIVFRILL